MLKALSKRESFQEGTNLRAWLFTILRNNFFSTHRKKGREVEDAEGAHAATMITIPDQHDKLVHQDLQAALARLSPDQRDVIILVGAEGMSYDEAAAALGCAVGTVKSRVNRARNRLAELMGLAGEDGIGGIAVAQRLTRYFVRHNKKLCSAATLLARLCVILY